MKVFVTGATGLVGGRLCSELLSAGVEIVALSRREHRSSAATGLRWVRGDPAVAGDWLRALDGVDAVVHLAGESVAGGRWTPARKKRLHDSRVESTRRIVAAFDSSPTPPRTFVCASATGFYGSRGEERLDEGAAVGDDFLASLCNEWEAAARGAEVWGGRVVSLRFGVVLSARGGALARMLLPFRLGLGGPLGPAGRWFPWIHEDDALGLLHAALADGSQLSGPVNAVAPEAVRMGTFAKTLGRVLHRPAILPVPLAALRLVLGEMGEALVPGQQVIPAAASAAGYPFRQPALEEALRACLAR